MFCRRELRDKTEEIVALRAKMELGSLDKLKSSSQLADLQEQIDLRDARIRQLEAVQIPQLKCVPKPPPPPLFFPSFSSWASILHWPLCLQD